MAIHPEQNTITLNDVREAVNLPDFDSMNAQALMSPVPRGPGLTRPSTPPREAGVLTLIHPLPDGEMRDRLHVVLTLRTDNLRGHSGQVSFPGGKCDPTDESHTETALRETCEELGLCEPVTVLGTLSPFYIPVSHFNVYPTVGALETEPVLMPNPVEVAEVFTFALDDLLDDRFKDVEYRNFQGYRVKIPYYHVGGHKVWGATAIMLSELEQRLRAVLA